MGILMHRIEGVAIMIIAPMFFELAGFAMARGALEIYPLAVVNPKPEPMEPVSINIYSKKEEYQYENLPH